MKNGREPVGGAVSRRTAAPRGSTAWGNIGMKDHKPDQKPTLMQVIGSVLAAAVGIQSRKNRERDFKHGKASSFVIAGALFAVLFVITVFSVVHFVLMRAGG